MRRRCYCDVRRPRRQTGSSASGQGSARGGCGGGAGVELHSLGHLLRKVALRVEKGEGVSRHSGFPSLESARARSWLLHMSFDRTRACAAACTTVAIFIHIYRIPCLHSRLLQSVTAPRLDRAVSACVYLVCSRSSIEWHTQYVSECVCVCVCSCADLLVCAGPRWTRSDLRQRF